MSRNKTFPGSEDVGSICLIAIAKNITSPLSVLLFNFLEQSFYMIAVNSHRTKTEDHRNFSVLCYHLQVSNLLYNV